MNAVTCLQWVKKGVAKAHPDHIKLTENEISDLVKDMKKSALSDSDESEAEMELPRKRKVKRAIKEQQAPQTEKESDSDSDDEESNPLNLAGATYYSKQSDDPHLSKEPDSDDDLEILSNDNIIAVGKVNKNDCNLEVYVYNEQESNCWCHHDYILPTIPLCLEWLDFDPGSEKHENFVAVGSMSSDIELWDLDVLETLEPAFVLHGQERVEKSSSKKKKKAAKAKGHSLAVLDLAWNSNRRHILASASADFTIGLWDLEQGEMVSCFQHDEKVQSIQWHATDVSALLSGCADHTIRLFDCQHQEPDVIRWRLNGEVENVIWDTANSNCFLASTDVGLVYYFDKRNSKKAIFDFKAHKKSVSGLSLSADINGCLVTCSSDESIKMWDINDHNSIKNVMTREINIGELFCVSTCPDGKLLYAVGGEREMKVLNLKKNASVIEHFGLSGGDKDTGDVDVPINGGLDEQDEDDAMEEEPTESGDTVKKWKKTHRGKRTKKNKINTENSAASVAEVSKNVAKDTASVNDTSNKKKKKKKKAKAKENHVDD